MKMRPTRRSSSKRTKRSPPSLATKVRRKFAADFPRTEHLFACCSLFFVPTEKFAAVAHRWFRFRVPDVFFLGETQGFGIVALFSPLASRILLLMRQEVCAAGDASIAMRIVDRARVSPHVDSCMAAADTNKETLNMSSH